MKTYKCYIPEWSVLVEAESEEEAKEMACEYWDNDQNNLSPIIIKELK